MLDNCRKACPDWSGEIFLEFFDGCCLKTKIRHVGPQTAWGVYKSRNILKNVSG